MSQLRTLKAATSLHQLADLLGYKASALSYLLYKLDESRKYKTFEVPKRSGGTRQIAAPTDELKLLQKRVSNILQNCIEEINKTYKRSEDDEHRDRIAHGFKRKRSIISNARWHRNKRFVFNLDLEDFFGTINFGRVRGFFMKDRNFSLSPKTATILAQIACYKNALPQGSPCSPVISNLIGHVLDIHLAKLARQTGCTYTRYADDLSFSTNKLAFPEEIAKCIDENNQWLPGDELSRLITKSGFAINAKKTRMQYRDSRQEVTGLVVNSKVNVRHEYRHDVRAMVHRLFTTGIFHFEHTETNASGIKIKKKFIGKLTQLHGMLGFIDRIDLCNKSTQPERTPKEAAKSLTSKEQMYSRFLMFKDFYAAESPVVICEGKTDNVYLTHAIRSLVKHYPQLATVNKDGKIDIKIRRFKYSGTSTGRILGIASGGGPNLNRFMVNYKENISRFKARGKKHPVIILIDNDDGAASIYKTIQSITGKKVTCAEPYIHIVGNMYVVATPLLAAKSSKIEDFFDASTLGMIWNKKGFDPSNDHDSKTHYGKSVFAYKVVLPNADKINFDGFKAILDRFVEVINEHSKKPLPPAVST